VAQPHSVNAYISLSLTSAIRPLTSDFWPRIANPALRERCSRITKASVTFQFDPRKSESNKAKHGIDFVEAQALWKSKQVVLRAKDALEKRYMVIGTIGAQHWSAIITYRGTIIRIISVRRSTPSEIDTYEKVAG
jgi:uncharacterized DUF497 family protein